MSERVLRGSRLGTVSYETETATDRAARQEVAYLCPTGHRTVMPFAVEAEIPATWECKVCRAVAKRVNGPEPEPKKVKPVRTHWDMLLERRSFDDLEEVLAERLAVLHENDAGHKKSA